MKIDERLKRYLGQKPQFEEAAFIAPDAIILGDVIFGKKSSLWYGAIVRGDINQIRIGAGTNLQDGTIVHLADDAGVEVGEFTTVGHRAILHACTIGNECLIGMGSTILDHAQVGDRSIIGANSLVPQRMQIPPGSLVYGNPARIIRQLSEKEQNDIRGWAEKYIHVAAAHAARTGDRI